MAPQQTLALPTHTTRSGRLSPVRAAELWPDDLLDHDGLRGRVIRVAIVGGGDDAVVRIVATDRDGAERAIEIPADTTIRRIAP